MSNSSPTATPSDANAPAPPEPLVGWHALRSLAWALAMACVVGMFVAAA